MPEKNALAELAEDVYLIKQGLSELNEDNDLVLADSGLVILDKVQRIIAELAKYDRTGVGPFEIGKCRAIAQEGSENEGK